MLICTVCNNEEARISIRQIDKKSDQSVSLDICLKCAIDHGLWPTQGPLELKRLLQPDIAEILAKAPQVAPESVEEGLENLFLFEPGSSAGKGKGAAVEVIRCPSCRTSFEEIRTSARFGCHQCYATFEQEAATLLAKLHGAKEHKGNRPPNLERLRRRREELGQLKQLMDAQILVENYEEAAKIRDRIATLEATPIDRDEPAVDESRESQ